MDIVCFLLTSLGHNLDTFFLLVMDLSDWLITHKKKIKKRKKENPTLMKPYKTLLINTP
jgi:hypothetical protein